MIINHNEQPCTVLVSQGRLQTLAGSWFGGGRCARDGYSRVSPTRPHGGPGAGSCSGMASRHPTRSHFFPTWSRGDAPEPRSAAWGHRGRLEGTAVQCQAGHGDRSGCRPLGAAAAPPPPRHSTEFDHSRSLQKSQAQQGAAGPGEFIQGKRSRGPATCWSGDGGGTGGPDPAAAGAVARHGDPWHGFRRPAAARTVRVSAPLAVGEQTC